MTGATHLTRGDSLAYPFISNQTDHHSNFSKLDSTKVPDPRK